MEPLKHLAIGANFPDPATATEGQAVVAGPGGLAFGDAGGGEPEFATFQFDMTNTYVGWEPEAASDGVDWATVGVNDALSLAPGIYMLMAEVEVYFDDEVNDFDPGGQTFAFDVGGGGPSKFTSVRLDRYDDGWWAAGNINVFFDNSSAPGPGNVSISFGFGGGALDNMTDSYDLWMRVTLVPLKS